MDVLGQRVCEFEETMSWDDQIRAAVRIPKDYNDFGEEKPNGLRSSSLFLIGLGWVSCKLYCHFF